MKKSTLFVSLLFAACFGLNAQVVVVPSSATSTMTTAFGTSLTTAYNGTGMLVSPSLTADHEPTTPSNSVVFNTGGSVTFNFSGIQSINGISFWNQNAGGPSTDTGLDSVIFYASTNGVNYTVIPGAPTRFTQIFTDTSAPQIFTFTPVMASSIRMDIVTNHGGTLGLGFGEIAFSSAPVGLDEAAFDLQNVKVYPNPSKNTIALAGIGKNREYILYNIGGKEMKRGRVSEEELIDIESFDSGLYFLQIDGVKQMKVVKE